MTALYPGTAEPFDNWEPQRLLAIGGALRPDTVAVESDPYRALHRLLADVRGELLAARGDVVAAHHGVAADGALAELSRLDQLADQEQEQTQQAGTALADHASQVATLRSELEYARSVAAWLIDSTGVAQPVTGPAIDGGTAWFMVDNVQRYQDTSNANYATTYPAHEPPSPSPVQPAGVAVAGSGGVGAGGPGALGAGIPTIGGVGAQGIPPAGTTGSGLPPALLPTGGLGMPGTGGPAPRIPGGAGPGPVGVPLPGGTVHGRPGAAVPGRPGTPPTGPGTAPTRPGGTPVRPGIHPTPGTNATSGTGWRPGTPWSRRGELLDGDAHRSGPGVAMGPGTSTPTSSAAGNGTRTPGGYGGMPLGAGAAGRGDETHQRAPWLIEDDPDSIWFAGIPAYCDPVIGAEPVTTDRGPGNTANVSGRRGATATPD